MDIYVGVMYLYPCNVLFFVLMQIKLNVPESSKHLYYTREAHTKLDANHLSHYKVQSQSRYYLIVTRLESITTVTKCHQTGITLAVFSLCRVEVTGMLSSSGSSLNSLSTHLRSNDDQVRVS